MQGLSFSDVMYVTKHNMANAVASVSKQLEHVSEALAVSKMNDRNTPEVLQSPFFVMFLHQ